MKNKKIILFFSLIIIIAITGGVLFNHYKTDSLENKKEQNITNNEEININSENLTNTVTNYKENKIDEGINTINEKEAVEETTISEKEEKKTEKNDTEYRQEKNKKLVVIDPGHQKKGDNSKEPIGPGATEQKAKVTTGATGVSTGQTEAELNLKVSLLLQEELENRGYSVIMTRTTNNVNISNSERAAIANNAGADVFVRIHADSVDSSSVVRNVNIMSDSK